MTHTVIRGGTVYDGRGGPGRDADIVVKDGRVAEVVDGGADVGPDTEVVDATGCWVTPGFIDLHTHYDAEVEIAPSLFESLRHGVTTVVTGSCSLSMAMGEPDHLANMFCRVEGIPRSVVLPLFREIKDWDSPTEYIDHLASKPLGPNVACLLGHSTIRGAAMGMERALDKRVRPNGTEMGRMKSWLEEALDVGYIGLSISTLPWDKMDGDEFRSRPMPSVFARWREYRALSRILRRRERVLQAVPNISTKLNVPLFFLQSMGLFRKALKTTIISMMDVRADRMAFRLAGILSRLCNRLLRGNFRMQALPNVFDLWADGIDLVVFEEFEAGASALHLTDAVRQRALLGDPEYRERFKKQWRNRLLPRAYHRNFRHSEILACPDPSVVGKSFNQLADERNTDPVDVFLDLVMEHGKQLRWYTVMGNDRPKWLEWIVDHPDILIGFSDAGAHLRNMAHYNYPLRMLKMVLDAQDQGRSFMTVERAVQRLTSEIGDWLGLDAGSLRPGDRADLVVIDPAQLGDDVEAIHEQEMPQFGGLRRLVRRNDAAVPAVMVGGQVAARHGTPTAGLGERPGFGQVLRAS